ncbi:MAG: dockerin type I repeat-containing protein [Clostridia bacterium]|nr:dockerin type I repeat-containing protein [Clostridia bacterium]
MKKYTKLLAIVLCLSMLLPLAVTYVAAQALYGDVNGDGLVDIQDIMAVRDAIFGNGDIVAADVNGDGKVDVEDIILLADIIFGKGKHDFILWKEVPVPEEYSYAYECLSSFDLKETISHAGGNQQGI